MSSDDKKHDERLTNEPEQTPPDRQDRRSWLRRSAGVAATGALGYPVLQYAGGCSKHEAPKEKSVSKTVVLCTQRELGPNQMRLVHKRGKTILVYRIGDGPPMARSAKCTHMGCTVRYRPAKADIHCPCHNAIYDAKTGAVVSGPAHKSLASYPVRIKDGSLLIDL